MLNTKNSRLLNEIVVITGGAGLLGQQHALAVLDEGGIAVLIDSNFNELRNFNNKYSIFYPKRIFIYKCDLTNENQIKKTFDLIFKKIGNPTGLINNAAINPSVEKNLKKFTRVENLDLNQWDFEINVGLKAAFICSRIFAMNLIQKKLSGCIVNISSDHGIISPNQNLYKVKNVPKQNQQVKPITYSVIKHALHGMTKYLATYWAEDRIRVNTLSPGGVLNNQPRIFLRRFNALVPMNRPANPQEYRGAIVFLLSKDSSYMTGSNLVIDGGRTIW